MKKRNIVSVPFESILCDKSFNSREIYDGIKELAESIKTDGLLQPIGVTRRKDPHGENEYYLIYGFRRYLAISQIREDIGFDAFAELDVVLNEGNMEDLRIRNLKENIERDHLKPAELSKAICTLVNAGMKQEEIALRLGRPQSWISLHYKVATKLSTKARNMYEDGNLTLEQAVNLADIPEDNQNDIVDKVLDAPSRAAARKIVKTAAKEAQEGKRKYATKSRPTLKNLTQLVSDASFAAESANMVSEEEAFWKGVSAGLRVSLGDFEFIELHPDGTEYVDVNYHAKTAKLKADATSVESAESTDDAVDEEAPKPKKRGRPRGKKNEVSKSL